MRSFLYPTAAAVLTATLVAVLDRRLAEQDAPPSIEVVDLQQLLTEQVSDVSHQKLSTDQQQAAASAYAIALNDALEAVAHGDHAVLLVKPAALIGALDVTDRVRALIRMGLDLRKQPSAATTGKNP
jgi:hypothetical protein